MPHTIPLSRSTRLIWTFLGSGLFLATVAILAFGAKSGGPGPGSSLRVGWVLFLGTLLVAAWMSRLVPSGRAKFVGGMAGFGALPLLGTFLFPNSEFWMEFTWSSGWLFPWYPLFIAGLQSRKKTSHVPVGVSTLFWFLLVGPALVGLVLLLTAVLA